MKQKGSALLLVLIIIAAVVTIAFSTQRLSLVQFAQSTAEEDNIYAYYAAKSGLEDGLIRYRYDRNVETASGKVFRFNVTSGVSVGEVDNTAPAAGANQIYDLKVEYKKNELGDRANLLASRYLNQDDSVELSGFPSTGSPYYVRIVAQFVSNVANAPCSNNDAFIQLQQTVVTAGGATAYPQQTFKRDGKLKYDTADFGNVLISQNGDATSTIRFRSYGCSIRYYIQTTQAKNGTDLNGPQFDSLSSYVTATGYYGKAKRTLVAEIDRRNGVLLNIYDFNLYAGKGSIQPR